jgi:hypothetical protein
MISWFTSLRFALNDSPTVSNNALTRVTSHNRSRSVTAPAGRQRLTPSRRRRWREGHRIDVGVSARSRAPTTQRTIMVGRFGRVVMRRDGTGRGRRLIPSWRWRWPGGGAGDGGAGPLSGGTGRIQRTGGPPLRSARAGLLMPIARNRTRFFEIAIRSRQNRLDIPRSETPPSFSTDGYRAEICDRGRSEPGRNTRGGDRRSA